MKRQFIAIPALLFLLFLTVSESLCDERTFEKKFSVSPGGTLTVKTDVGSIAIRGTASSEVSVVAEIRGREKDVKDFEVVAKQTSDGVEVIGRTSRGMWRFFSWSDLEVRFTINVPNSYNVKTNTSGGEIAVHNLKGFVRGGTSGGDITLTDIDGLITVNTSGGQITIDRVQGNINAETSGGDVGVGSVVGDVDVGTSGGNVRVSDVIGRVRAQTSGGDVVVKVKEENKGIFAETSGGNIDVIVPSSVSATVDAKSSGGDVRCDLPVTVSGKVNESRIRGSINGGGNTIYAHTSGGDIRIRSGD